MQEHRIKKRWRFFIYCGGPIMITLFIWTITEIVKNINGQFFLNIVLICLISSFIILLIAGIIDTHKRKVVFLKGRIIFHSAFSKKELLFTEIKGYRQSETEIALESENKSIKISKYTENYDKIVNDIILTFPDLDFADAFIEKHELLNDNSLGKTEADREAKLKQAKWVAIILNILAFISFAWILFYPKPYELLFTTCSILTLVAIFTVKYYKGIMRIDEKRGSQLPNIAIVLIFPSLGMALRVLFDYNILEYKNLWSSALLLTGFLFFLLFFKQKEFSFEKAKDYFMFTVMSIILFAYSYGLIGFVNCYYDNTTPRIYTAKILDKHISGSQIETYQLKLSKWENQTEEQEANVNKDFYSKVEIGQELTVVYHEGYLDIPWYYVQEK